MYEMEAQHYECYNFYKLDQVDPSEVDFNDSED